MFFTWPNVPPNALTTERAELAERIASGLAGGELVESERRRVVLRLADSEERISGDISRVGVTVYLGGFDWVTFQTPQFLLQKFPEFLPLPQQVFGSEDSAPQA